MITVLTKVICLGHTDFFYDIMIFFAISKISMAILIFKGKISYFLKNIYVRGTMAKHKRGVIPNSANAPY